MLKGQWFPMTSTYKISGNLSKLDCHGLKHAQTCVLKIEGNGSSFGIK